jgi:predicted amidohydrolase
MGFSSSPTTSAGRSIEAADQTGTKMICHCAGYPRRPLADRLRPGDIITHSFQWLEQNAIGGDGRIRGEMKEAREKDVILDSGGGETQPGEFSYAPEDSTRTVKTRLTPVITVKTGKVVRRVA